MQVDAARALARDAYRADQASIEKQKSWKSRVGELKEAQDNLRTTKEAFYRCVGGLGSAQGGLVGGKGGTRQSAHH